MYEDILPRRALDKAVPFRPIKPLHCSLLSHGRNSFSYMKNSSPDSPFVSPRQGQGTPSREPVELGCIYAARKIASKSKRLLSSQHATTA